MEEAEDRNQRSALVRFGPCFRCGLPCTSSPNGGSTWDHAGRCQDATAHELLKLFQIVETLSIKVEMMETRLNRRGLLK